MKIRIKETGEIRELINPDMHDNGDAWIFGVLHDSKEIDISAVNAIANKKIWYKDGMYETSKKNFEFWESYLEDLRRCHSMHRDAILREKRESEQPKRVREVTKNEIYDQIGIVVLECENGVVVDWRELESGAPDLRVHQFKPHTERQEFMPDTVFDCQYVWVNDDE